MTTARRPAFFTGTAKRGQFNYDEANLLAAEIRYTIYIRVVLLDGVVCMYEVCLTNGGWNMYVLPPQP